MPGNAQSLEVKVQLQEQQEQEWIDAPDLQLDPASSAKRLPLTVGEVSFGPIYVQQGSGPREGRHCLRISLVDGAKLGLHPFRVPFDLVNASATSAALQEATEQLNIASAKVKQLQQQLKQVQKLFEGQEQSLRKKILNAGKYVPKALPVNTNNISSVLHTCQQSLVDLPDQRQPRYPAQPTEALRQELLAIPGVLGFISDLVHVTDDDDARLLSFQAGPKLQVLVVRDWDARLAIREFLRGNVYQPSILPLNHATALPPLSIPAIGELNQENWVILFMAFLPENARWHFISFPAEWLWSASNSACLGQWTCKLCELCGFAHVNIASKAYAFFLNCCMAEYK